MGDARQLTPIIELSISPPHDLSALSATSHEWFYWSFSGALNPASGGESKH